MTIGERIKKARKALDLTQQAFADRLGMKQNTIATYEMNRTNPSDPAVKSICREFNVDEHWLRTGEGDPFVQRSKEDELEQVFSAIAASDDELIKRIIRTYWKLDDKEKAAVKKLIDGFLSDGPSASPAAPASPPAPAQMAGEDPEIDAEMEAYRQRRIEEKIRASQTSAAKEHGAG